MGWKMKQMETGRGCGGSCCAFTRAILDCHSRLANRAGDVLLAGMGKIALFLLIYMALTLCAVGLGMAQIEDIPWPMLGHDAQHTRRSSYKCPRFVNLKWKLEMVYGGLPTIGSDGTIYLASNDEHLDAFNPDGSLRWKFQMAGRGISSSAIGSDGTIYHVAGGGFYALNPDGSLRWELGAEDRSFDDSPAIGSDGTIYVGAPTTRTYYGTGRVVTFTGGLYALDPSGNLKWKFEIEDGIKYTPAIGLDGTVYVGSPGGNLYAVNPDGSLKWKFEAEDQDVFRTAPAIGPDGTIYVAARMGSSLQDYPLYAVNPDGGLRWKFKESGYYPPAIGSDGTIYVSSRDDHLYALDPDGGLKWEFKMEPGVMLSPPVIDSEGTIYVAGSHGLLYAFDPDGGLEWKFRRGYWNRLQIGAAPVIGPDGTIYVGGSEDDGYYLYALGSASGPAVVFPESSVNFGQVPVGSSRQIALTVLNVGDAPLSIKGVGSDSPEFAASFAPFTAPADSSHEIVVTFAPLSTGSKLATLTVDSNDPNRPSVSISLMGNFAQADSPWPMVGHDARHTNQSLYRGAAVENLKWKLETGYGIVSSPTIGSDGTIYLASYDKLDAFNPDGSLKWQTTGRVFSSPAVGSDGTIYLTARDGHLHALDPDGTLKWKFRVEDQVSFYAASDPVIGPDGTIYFTAENSASYLYAFNPDGSLRWKSIIGGVDRPPPLAAISPEGTIYVGNRYLSAFDPDGSSNGSVKEHPEGHPIYSLAIGSDGTIYVAYSDRLRAFSPDGSLEWMFEGVGGRFLAIGFLAIGPDGTVYASGGGLNAINPAGALKWRFGAESRLACSPTIDSDGTIYVGFDDNYLYAINPDGTVKWKFKIESSILSAPVIGLDGTVIIASRSGILYSFGRLASNVSPELRSGVVIPETGFRNTEFAFRVVYSDADNNPPASVILRIDDGAPRSMIPLDVNDVDYTNGRIYEYRTELSAGQHSYVFVADDGLAGATGDTAVHSGPVVSANAAPVLSDGSVTPHSGVANIEFVFRITYADAEDAPPSSIVAKIDSVKQRMTPVEADDVNYADGRIYEFRAGLLAGRHTFAFAASDGVAEAIGDTGTYMGPVVYLPDDPIIPGQWGSSFIVSDDSSAILDFRMRVDVSGGGDIFGTGGESKTVSRHAERVDIVNNEFEIIFRSSVGLDGVYQGRFTSPGTAEGTWEDYAVGSEIRPGTYNVMHGSGNWKASWSVTPYVEPPGAPIVTDIPDQSIDINGRFTEIRLDDYVSDPDNTDPQISWTYNGSAELTISISDARFAAVTTPEPGWIGSETITFTATDPSGLSDSDSATFTVMPLILLGDVNNDGKIRSNDAILVLRIAAGSMKPTEQQRRAADMNGDGKVRANDAILVLRKAAGLAAPSVPAARIGGITVALAETHGVAGETVTVLLEVDSINGLAGGDVCIAYDSAVLHAVGVSSDSDILLASRITDPGLVQISFACTDMMRSKALAKIRFDILTDDVSSLEFRDLDLYGPDTLSVDSRGVDGQFTSWAIPAEYSALLQNFPNPFNPETWIPYQLREASEVTISVYTILGELVQELDLGRKSAGLYTSQDRAAHWDGRNRTGEPVSSGVYFYTIQAGDFAAARKMVIAE